MKPARLDEKLRRLRREGDDLRALMLNLALAKMPLPIQRHDDPFLPFGKAIIDATRDLLAGYVFDLAAYLALGAAGAIALERTVAYAGAGGETLTILHAPFVGADYVQAAVAFSVDAVTLTGDHPDHEAAYHAAGIGVFPLVGADAPSGHIPGARLVSADGSTTLWLVGPDVLYASMGDDFAARARAALQAWRRA